MLGLLGVLAFFALILGPIGFFLSLGVGPRVAALERAREHASDALLRKITDLEQRLRRIEERLAGKESLPIPVSPAAESQAETPAPVADVAAAVPAASAAAPSDSVTAAPQAEPAEVASIAQPIAPEETSPPTAPADDAAPAVPDAQPAPVEPEAVAAT